MVWRVKTIFPNGDVDIEDEVFESREQAERFIEEISAAYATGADTMEESGPNAFDNEIIDPYDIDFEIFEEDR